MFFPRRTNPFRLVRATAPFGLILLGVILAAVPATPQAAPTINISNSPQLFSTSPRIVTDSQGNVHALWVEQPIGTDQEAVRSGDVYYAMGSLGTLQISTPVNISNVDTVWCSTLEMCSIGVDDADRVYALWTEGRRVVLRIKTGTVWDEGFVVAFGLVYDAPRIAVTPNGDVFIIYWTNEGHVLSRARVNGVWEDEKEVGRWEYRTKLADIALGTNFIGAAWVERPSADQDANYQTAYAQRARTFNAAWSDSVQVAPSDYNQQHAAVELDSTDASHVIWTNEVGGQRIVYHARGNGSSFSGATAISASELLHYPFVAERGDDLYACWQVGSYRSGSSIDFNIRQNGAWQGVDAVPLSYGSTYADIAVTRDKGILFFIWDVNTITHNGEIFGWAKYLATVKTISGTVRRGGGPLPGVVMAGLPGSPATNASGQYAGTVSAGWTGTVTPTLAGHVFAPAMISYSSVFVDQTEQDYAATQVGPSALTVTAPNGNETLKCGSSVNISWTSSQAMDGIKIEYSTNGGGHWATITDSTANTGSWPWIVPYIPSVRCLVRVSNAQNALVNDVSDGVFTISGEGAPAKADFNGDGQEDILWRHYGSGGENSVWLMGAMGANLSGPVPNKVIESSSVGSVNRSRTGQAGSKRIYADARDAISGPATTERYADAREIGSLPLPGRLKPDSVEDPRQIRGGGGETNAWMTAADSLMSLSRRKGPVNQKNQEVAAQGIIGGAALPAVGDLKWQIRGTGDFNGDGKVDVLWRYDGPSGYNCVWFMDGTTVIGGVDLPNVTDSNWEIQGTGDFNGDGKVDILWRYVGSGGYNCVWFMNGTTVLGGTDLPSVNNSAWYIQGTGDFNADGKVDILWRYYGSGGYNCVWFMNDARVIGGADLPAVADLSWQIQGAGDFNSDYKADIVWRYYGSGGYNCLWLMNGTTLTGGSDLPSEAVLNWKIVSR